MFANWLKTSVLMAAIIALFGVIGALIGGKQGMLLALVFGGAMNLFSYWFSDQMVLKMYNAQEVDETSSPYLYNLIKELAGREVGGPSGLRKTKHSTNSLAHRTTWLRSDLGDEPLLLLVFGPDGAQDVQRSGSGRNVQPVPVQPDQGVGWP